LWSTRTGENVENAFREIGTSTFRFYTDKCPIVTRACVVGDPRAGKEHLSDRLFFQPSDRAYRSAPGHRSRQRLCSIQGGRGKIVASVFSSAEAMEALQKYTDEITHAICVYALSNPETFQHVQQWMGVLRKRKERPAPVLVVGNKLDLIHDPVPS
jgi:GTPase SAR1 family protein